MTFILIKHRVTNYSDWRIVYDNTQEMASEMGQLNSRVFQEKNNPNMVTVLTEFETIKHGENFINSGELKEAMKKAGVAEAPQIHFMNEN